MSSLKDYFNGGGSYGNDIDAINASLAELPDRFFPVGTVTLRMDAIDPSTIYGGTWALITGDAALTFGDGTEQDGTASGDNNPAVPLPVHNHTMNHDHPSAKTSTDTHRHNLRSGSKDAMDHYYKLTYNRGIAGINKSETSGSWTSSTSLISNDSHNHTVNIPNYTGNTGNSGESNATLDVRGARIAINVWQRTA